MDDQTRKEIGRRFGVARKRLGLTQQDVADRAGVSLGTIGSLENGRTVPQSANRARIVEALGQDIFDEDLGDAARCAWPDDVKVVVDILGGYLAALPPKDRSAQVSKWLGEMAQPKG